MGSESQKSVDKTDYGLFRKIMIKNAFVDFVFLAAKICITKSATKICDEKVHLLPFHSLCNRCGLNKPLFEILLIA